MNVVFSIRFFLASMTSLALIVGPRMLYFFGLRANELDVLMSPWATFIILLIVGGMLTFTWLKQIKLAPFIIIGLIVVAAVLTFYFCELTLPF